MNALLDHDRAVILHGDSSQLGNLLAPNTVDAIVCDPPAGVAFMGRGWDSDKGGRDHWIAWLQQTLAASFAALKPGGHGLFWALPRTSHWTATALENLGFEIRDRVSHIFLSGFPKSLNVALQPGCAALEGWGTALKPAIEDWYLVRKPLAGTVARNVLAHGTGGINIGACRVGDEQRHNPSAGNLPDRVYGLGMGVHSANDGTDTTGRWPPHLIVDDGVTINDIDDPARYFYCPKPSKSEVELGLEHLPKRSGGEATGREDGSAGVGNPRAGAGRGGGRANIHPTKKPVALMRWLCRLVTPPNGIVLDPFAGSGTTGVAALAEGFRFIGCEQGGENDEYLPILLGRIQHALKTL